MSTQIAMKDDLQFQEKVRRRLLQRIEGDDFDLPLLPQVASQVLTLSHDPDSDAAKLSALLHQDQALAGQTLRVANSPAYMPRSPIVSLQQAVSWLGMRTLADLALLISMQNGVFRIQGFDAEIKNMWRQAFATGLYGKEIARIKRQNVENAFLCGLLHTIGKPVILRELIDIQQQYEVMLSWKIMESMMSEVHAQAGAKMATAWKLPAQVIDSIIYFSDYTHAPSANKTAIITCFADHLASFLLDLVPLEEETLRDLPVVHDLNLYPEDVTALLEQGTMILQTVNSMAI